MVFPGTLVKIFESGRMVWDCEERVNGEPFRFAVYFSARAGLPWGKCSKLLSSLRISTIGSEWQRPIFWKPQGSSLGKIHQEVVNEVISIRIGSWSWIRCSLCAHERAGDAGQHF